VEQDRTPPVLSHHAKLAHEPVGSRRIDRSDHDEDRPDSPLANSTPTPMKRASLSATPKWQPSTSKATPSIPSRITPSSPVPAKPQVEALISRSHLTSRAHKHLHPAITKFRTSTSRRRPPRSGAMSIRFSSVRSWIWIPRMIAIVSRAILRRPHQLVDSGAAIDSSDFQVVPRQIPNASRRLDLRKSCRSELFQRSS
jgi:hypothetical protein